MSTDWKFFYKPTTTAIPIIGGTRVAARDAAKIARKAQGGTVDEINIVNTTTSMWGQLHDLASRLNLGTYQNNGSFVYWPGAGNIPDDLEYDLYVRCHAVTTGGLFGICGVMGQNNGAVRFSSSHYYSNDHFEHTAYDDDGVRMISFRTSLTQDLTIGSIYDFIFQHRFNPDLNSNPLLSVWLNGSKVADITGTSDFVGNVLPDSGVCVGIGSNQVFAGTCWLYEHFGIYNGHIPNPEDYYPGGPAEALLLTLTTTAVDTDPGAANVLSGVEYIFGGSTITGTLAVPVASTGTADTVPMNEIKEQIRYVLAINNTSSGAPVQDLSENLARKVKQVLKVNPEKIRPSDNELPCVTVFIESKETEPRDIAKNGSTGKRRANLNLNVVGLVYEPFTTNYQEDPADEDLENLMENVEKILRGYDQLGNNVRWQHPTSVTYHNLGYDEQNHYRGAIMELRATVYY